MLSTSGRCAVSVVLKQSDPFMVIELTASKGRPAFVHLTEGTFIPELSVGIRPGTYSPGEISFKRLPAIRKFFLLAGRLSVALRGGVTLQRIYHLARRALLPAGTFGIRPAGGTPQALGPLLSADYDISNLCAIHEQIFQSPNKTSFLVRYKDGQISKDVHGLQAQTYTEYSTDPSVPHDVILYIDPEDQLSPDALALFAASFSDDPKVAIALADVWIDGKPTTRVAFDPLLYRDDNYPTPYAVRKDFSTEDLTWQELEPLHSIIDIPVGSSKAVSFLSPPQTPLPIFRPKVSIIIPTRDRADLLSTCLARLFEATHWPHEVIVVDNGSVEKSTFELFDIYRLHGLRTVRADIPFNFSTLCNIGAKEAKGEYLVFMNNDIEVISNGWLGEMMSYATLPDVGVVGARLLYRDKRLQHGGVALGLTQLCGHMWRGLNSENQTELPQLSQASLRSAVSGALICMSREKFEKVNGFNEVDFSVTLNDIDLCLKLLSIGYYNVLAAETLAWHPESESRGSDESPEKHRRRELELKKFESRWRSRLVTDQWFPKAFSRATERYMLR